MNIIFYIIKYMSLIYGHFLKIKKNGKYNRMFNMFRKI